MSRIRKILLWLLIAVVVFTITGFFVAPPVLKSVLVKKLSARLDRAVTIEKISVNPYTLSVRVKGITVRQRAGTDTFLSIDELKGRIGLSFVAGVVTLHDLTLKNPYVNIARDDDGSYNFSDLLETREPAPSEKPGKESQGLTFSLRDITIVNGSADFRDGPAKKKHALRELNLAVPLLSNQEKYVNRDVRPSLSFKLNDDPYVIKGSTKPFHDSLETDFDIDFENVDIPHYLAYLPMKMRFTVPSGYLDTKMQVSFRQFPDRTPSLVVKGEMTISELTVNDEKGKTVVNLPAINITMRSIEPLAGKIGLSKVSIESPEFNVSRDKKGALNVLALVPETKEAVRETIENKDAAKTGRPAKAGEKAKKAFQCVIDAVELTGGKVLFTDLSLTEPSKTILEKVEMKGENISLAEGATGEFSASLLLNRKAAVGLKGKVGIDPFLIEAKVDLKGVDIRPFQPYFTDKVRVSVTSGTIQSSGDLVVTDTLKKGPSVGFKGTMSLTGLVCLDKETAENLLRFKSLHARSLHLGYNPTMITAKGVSLTDFYANIAIKADKTVNLQHIMVNDDAVPIPKDAKPAPVPAQAKTPSEKEGPIPVKVDTVTLQGGTIRFQDHSLTPAFSTRLNEVAGRISGLSSQENTTANVELRGTLDNSAPLEITGKINPLSKDLYVDLKASFKDMDLTPATPYSGKYAGYTIDKGKLSFDVQYLIEKRNLDSKNTIFIDQLTFGERVESPDATKLPVKLAVALLKDRKGQIKLDLPVTGSLDDPQFSVGRIILKIIVNLLTRAATAPFALIGALFGGGEELGYVEFDYGRTVINEASAKKLDTLAKALAEKPSLKLEIEGYVDKERDREGLKQYLVQKKVRTQKLKDLMKRSSEDIPVDNVKIEPGEYEKYLRLAYKSEKFPKPRNMIGLQKTIPVEEMEKLMVTHTTVTEEDLRSLAKQRSARVMQRIVKAGQVEAGRLFVVEPRSLSPEKKEKLKESRVDFKLK